MKLRLASRRYESVWPRYATKCFYLAPYVHLGAEKLSAAL